MTGTRPAPAAATGNSPAVPLHEALAGSEDLREFLEEFARIMAARLSAGGAEVWCAITLLRDGTVGTVAASTARAGVLDELQYDHDDGPCLTAAREQELVHVPDLAADERWGDYASAALAHGVHGAAAAPFDLPEPDRAALNVYAGAPHALDDDALAAVAREVSSASTALRLALRLARHRETEADLRTALSSRTTIDLAVGILMGQQRCSQDEAFELLAAAAGARGAKLREIAAELVRTTGGVQARTHFNDARASPRPRPGTRESPPGTGGDTRMA
ncbi:GAF and ANTAR domain-containing protein [Kocuria flava]|uniref:GAF and ANTAR domain-containing protein n=1 Tax=Kocuria flava TaxID=446860 RepID=UPI003F1A9333